MVTGCFGKLIFGRKTCEDRFLLFHGFRSVRIQFSDPIAERRERELLLATPFLTGQTALLKILNTVRPYLIFGD